MSDLLLEGLPDEIILKVFNYLKTKDLIHCGQLSRRIRAISLDESLWQNVKLVKEIVKSDFVETVVNRGCKSLTLQQVYLKGELKYISHITCPYSNTTHYSRNTLQGLGNYYMQPVGCVFFNIHLQHRCSKDRNEVKFQ